MTSQTPVSIKPRKTGDKPGVVLVIGVQHDDRIGAVGQGGIVTGFLVSAIAPVFSCRMTVRPRDSRLVRYCPAAVINQNDFGAAAGGDVTDGGFERFFGVISRRTIMGCLNCRTGPQGKVLLLSYRDLP